MPSDEDHAVYGVEDLDEDDDLESEEEEDLTLLPNPPLHDDEEEEDDSTSSSNLAAVDAPPSTAGAVTVAISGTQLIADSIPEPKRQRADDVSIVTVVEEKKPSALDESRKLFQRLWTDEDEIELLQGFLDFSSQRGTTTNSSSHHLDTTAFYDLIRSKLQLDFNKNQLVEKLRRLKKKYRNVLARIGSGKEYNFKSPHDQITFELSRKIWSESGVRGGVVEEAGLEDDDPNPSPIPNTIFNDHNNNNNNGVDLNSSEKKVPTTTSRKRSRAKIEQNHILSPQPLQSMAATPASIPNLVEETVRSCLSPLFKELVQSAMNSSSGSRGFGGVTLNPMPLFFGGQLNSMSMDSGDDKWRKQQILELEVYSKRLELVQDQIKTALEELKSKGG